MSIENYMLIHVVEKEQDILENSMKSYLELEGGGGHLLYKYTCGQTKDETLAHNSNQIWIYYYHQKILYLGQNEQNSSNC